MFVTLKNRYTYSVSDILGEGGFGKVYKGKDTFEDKDVAIKLINHKKQNDPNCLEFNKGELDILLGISK